MSKDIANLVHWACFMKNKNILKECIVMNYNLNEETPFYCYSPLMVAATQTTNLYIIKLLVNNGADVNHINYWEECLFNLTSNNEYLLFLKSRGVEQVKKPKENMRDEIIDILEKCSTKEAANEIDSQGLTPLLWAIYYERQNNFDYYLKLGADVNKAGKTGISPLMMAVTRQNFDVVKKLVKSGANINQFDNNGLTAIAYFDYLCPLKIIDYLFEHGAKIDPCISQDGKSPLMIAAIRNNKTYFDYFLSKNANVNFIDCDGNCILSYVILNENIKNAQKLIAKGANVDACGHNGKPPLAWSVFLNNPKITKFLLSNKANINFPDFRRKTALFYAEKYEYTEIRKLLEDNGAKATMIQNEDIFAAIQAKDLASIKKLLENCNFYNQNDKKETVIDVAVRVGDLDIINLLLDKEKDLYVHTALPAAIQNKNLSLVKLLLEKGANVNRIYKKTKQSPLLQAIDQKNADIVELLLKYNANVTTNEDPSPIQRAMQIGQGNIIKMLIEKADDLNETGNGKSYLQMAIDEKNINVIMILLKKGVDPRRDIRRLRELAEHFDELDIFLENLLELTNYKQENLERKTNKTEF